MGVANRVPNDHVPGVAPGTSTATITSCLPCPFCAWLAQWCLACLRTCHSHVGLDCPVAPWSLGVHPRAPLNNVGDISKGMDTSFDSSDVHWSRRDGSWRDCGWVICQRSRAACGRPGCRLSVLGHAVMWDRGVWRSWGHDTKCGAMSGQCGISFGWPEGYLAGIRCVMGHAQGMDMSFGICGTAVGTSHELGAHCVQTVNSGTGKQSFFIAFRFTAWQTYLVWDSNH